MTHLEKIAREWIAYGSYNGREVKMTKQLEAVIRKIKEEA